MAVLLVLEDREERRRASRYLVDHGCTVVTAGDGVAALKAIKRALFDVVVSDVQLAPRGGVWLWREAVAARPTLKGRFLFSTAAPLVELVDGPGEAFFLKPLDTWQLWSRIAALGGRTIRAGAQRGRASSAWGSGARRR